jgi:hypothetical protein
MRWIVGRSERFKIAMINSGGINPFGESIFVNGSDFSGFNSENEQKYKINN